MKKTILILALSVYPLLAQSSGSFREELLGLFSGVPQPFETRDDDELTPKCQTLPSGIFDLGYRTELVDFNAKTGMTTCKIYNTNGQKTDFTANTYSPAIYAQTNEVIPKSELVSLQQNDGKQDFGIIYNEPDGHISLSGFISAMMTLDPEIIDFNRTGTEGVLRLKADYTLMDIDDRNTGYDSDDTQKIKDSVAEKFNKANLAYYSSLFNNMSEIYGYVQNLLFVFIGMFFIGKIGFDKGMRALDKSKESHGEAQWLAKFYVPVLTVGLFFAPIPEDNGMNATIVQKMIRFMVSESSAIADKASAIGVDTYVQRLYATVGAMTAEGEASIREANLSSSRQADIYKNIFITNEGSEGACKYRFPHAQSFIGISHDQIYQFDRNDINNVTSNTDSSKQEVNQQISFETCRLMEYRMMVQRDTAKKSERYIISLEETYDNNKLKALLKNVNEALQDQQNKLGWTNAIIIPSVAIMVETLPLVQNASSAISGSNAGFLEDAISGAMDPDVIKQMLGGNITGGNESKIGELVGQFAYFTLPGAQGIYRALHNNPKEALHIANILSKTSSGEARQMTGDGTIDDKTYLLATSSIYEWVIQRLPVIVSVIAGIVAFIGYVVELAKYFYISPFVVAFALTTKKTHKIIDFMVTGLTVFFKPILLVIFIFFALFIYTLVEDIFLNYAVNQFNVLKFMASGEGFTETIISLLTVFLKIFGSLGATYIMWKLILNGPAWAMKLVGVDNAQTDMISESLSQRMDRAGFRM